MNKGWTSAGSLLSFVAIAMSWTINHSIFWAILHAFCGGFYVLYWLFSYTKFQDWMMQWVVY